MNLLLLAILILGVGALLAAMLAPWPRLATLSGTWIGVLGALLGLCYAAPNLIFGRIWANAIPHWSLPNLEIAVGSDPLTNFFLVPLFFLGAITLVYGHGYLKETASPGRRVRNAIIMNLLIGSMALVLIARHVTVFLLAWETMSLLAYFLITLEHEKLEARRAGMSYLVLAHIGVTSLIAMFLLLAQSSHSFLFASIVAGIPPTGAIATTTFLLALVGFGMKAGLLPLHVWLPQAHAAAPSHASALMSGILIKLGIYGILRVVLLLGGPQAYWGSVLLVLGVCSALYGISLGCYQRDLKRVFAYSSIENMGIVTLGLGLGYWGQTADHPLVSILGFSGALLHLYHHVVMKGLMFCLSGGVLHACGTKDLEQLGGLAKRMPRTFALFALGAVALSGLPPLNAFVSEWLLYRGLMQGSLVGVGGGAVACIFAVAMLSLVSAIAALAYARVVGVAMLGEPRSPAANAAHESHGGELLAPLVPLACVLLLQALFPGKILDLVSPALRQLQMGAFPTALGALGLATVGRMNLLVLTLLGCVVVAVAFKLRARQRNAYPETPTWDCGYVAPTARMQYTARGVSELFTEVLVPSPFTPRIARQLPQGIFARPAKLESDSSDPLTRDAYEPLLSRLATLFASWRLRQQGHLHIYLLYILVALLVALGYSILRPIGGAP